jgi:energy-coupling factor transporter ATP-binding protein EcfA2
MRKEGMKIETSKRGVTGCAAIVATIIILVGGAWWVSEAGEEILAALNVLLMALVATVILSCLIWLGLFLWYSTHRAIHDRARARKEIADAKRAERDAQHTVVVARGDEQVYIADENPVVHWRALHRDPRTFSNGIWSEPKPIEIATYLAWLESLRPKVTPHQTVPGLINPPPVVDLLGQISDFERMLVVGSSGSGKTTLLQHIIARQQGEVVVIDPHDDTHTWPKNAQVVGGGQDYDAIERALVALVAKVKERYRQRAAGKDHQFMPLLVVIDEWREIVNNTDRASSSMKVILTGGRKVVVGTAIASHSERVGPLGIKGEGDLKDGFVVIRLRGDKTTGFSATLDKGDGEIPVQLPGPHRPQLAARVSPPLVVDVQNTDLPMDEVERQIVSAWDAGNHSVTKIGAQVYGQRGGWQNERVREVLAKFGRI